MHSARRALDARCGPRRAERMLARLRVKRSALEVARLQAVGLRLLAPHMMRAQTVEEAGEVGFHEQRLAPAACRNVVGQPVEGVPEVTWKPDLRPTRVYTVKGAEKLTDEFVAPTNSRHRFFKVEVKLGDR